MAEVTGVPGPTHQLNYNLESLSAALDPISLILDENSNSFRPKHQTVQRGPRYKAYAELRETKLRMKSRQQQSHEPESILMANKKRVVSQGSQAVSRHNSSSIVARSVPDFSAALRKENRKPMPTLPSVMEMTPPANSKAMNAGMVRNLGGSKSANAGEKRGGGVMVRKSYASLEEIRGLSSAAASAINGESRGRTNRGINIGVLNYRKY